MRLRGVLRGGQAGQRAEGGVVAPSCLRNRPIAQRSGVRARAAEPKSSNDVDLWEIHEELLREIEERKRHQAKLLAKLNKLVGDAPEAPPLPPPTRQPPILRPLTPTMRPTSAAAPPAAQPRAPPPPPTPRAPPPPPPAPVQAAAPAQAPPTARLAPPPPPALGHLNQQLQRPPPAAPPPPAYKPPAASVAAPPKPAYAPPAQPTRAPPRPQAPTVPPLRSLGAPPAPPAPAAPRTAPPTHTATPAGAPMFADTPTLEPPKPPPLAGENVMNIVMVGAECAPWSKTGGLGDVMGALPKSLAKRGHRVMTIAPRYAIYDEAWETGIRRPFRVFGSDQEVGYFHAYLDGVDYVFVDHPSFHAVKDSIYSGEREQLLFRCALLCKAALEAVWHVPCGGVPYGDSNTAFIANDWHTALLPVYLQAHYRDYGQMTYARSVFVIHNIAHQGRGPFVESEQLELNEHYREQMRLYDPIGGEHMNVIKAGLTNAHRVIAVSDGYAWECQTQEGGWGLDAIVREAAWKLRGIVNGIDYDDWHPARDRFLQSDGYTNFDSSTLRAGKAQCKAALQRELGLPEDPNVPLLGFIGRLDYQKGIDLIRDSFDWLVGQKVQLVMLGSGRDDLAGDIRNMESRARSQCRAWVGFSVQLAHRINAGCDILLMPSRFEPCGLNQLYAMAAGTVPVVHAVGGLRDTVKPYNAQDNTGTGWTFERAEGDLMRNAVWAALSTYREQRGAFEALQLRGMAQDLSWDQAAKLYEEVLVAAKYQW